MDTIQQFNYYTGGLDNQFILAAMLWAFVGVIIWKYIHFARREVKDGFNALYFIKNNIGQLLFNFIFTIAFIRFTSDFVEYLNMEFLHFGKDPMFVYILFGFGQQIAIDYLRKRIK